MNRIIFLLVMATFLTGCKTSSINEYESSYAGEEVSDCSALEPDNSYSPGSGHYAGFEWAQKKEVSSCSGNSQSFIEGCEEYLLQSEDYENCLNQ